MLNTKASHAAKSLSGRPGTAPAVCSRTVRGLVTSRASSGYGASSVLKKTSIHNLIEGGALLLPGCYDALSSKILEQAGHRAAFVSGFAVSASLLGEPDLGLLTPPEMARIASHISSSVRIPVIADADTGGGNVLNVRRTIRQLIASGVKGCYLEDQQWPKRAGHMRNKAVIDMGEFAAKVFAAREAIGDADFFLVARTDARATSAKYGLEEAIKRANLYIDAGADASFVEAPRNDEELAEIGRSTKGVRVCNMVEGGSTPLHTPEELEAMGFSIITYPMSALYAVTRSLMDVYTTLAETGTTRDRLGAIADFREFDNIIGMENMLKVEERLTRREGEKKLTVRVRAPARPAA